MRPWLSVWLKPGATIERVLAERSLRTTWTLAALSGVASIVNLLLDAGLGTEILDWRVIGGSVLGGIIFGLFGLYVMGWCLRLSGWLFAGKAPSAQLRVLVAWTFVPTIAGLALAVAALVWLKISGASARSIGSVATILQAVTAAASLWSLVIAVPMIARVQKFRLWKAFASGVLASLFYVAVLTLPLSIRTFLFHPFSNPSGSNEPAMRAGDHFFASKYAYGYSRFSLPFSAPLFSGRIWAAEPKRGDVVVFRLPKEPSTDYVKRVIGLPGDRIQMINGELHINGTAVKRERIEDFTSENLSRSVKQWRETLPNGITYNTLDLVDDGYADNTESHTVPAGHYFVLGDNRDNSTDSRFPQIGMVPFENLVGRVTIIYFSRSPSDSSPIRFDRIGHVVR